MTGTSAAESRKRCISILLAPKARRISMRCRAMSPRRRGGVGCARRRRPRTRPTAPSFDGMSSYHQLPLLDPQLPDPDARVRIMSAAMWKESSTTPLSISRRMEERAEPSGEGGVRRMELKQISTPSGTYQIYVGIRIESLKRRRHLLSESMEENIKTG